MHEIEHNTTVGAVRLRRRSLRPWIFAGVALVLLVGIGWTLFWRFAAEQSAASLDAWIGREKAFHRVWTCPDRRISGFPFAIEIACRDPHFDGNIFGRHYAGSLHGFIAAAKLADPTVVRIAIAPPFAVVSADRTTDLSFSWDHLDVVLGGLPQDVAQVTVSGRGLSVKGRAPKLPPLDARAQTVTAVFGRGAADNAIDFQVAFREASWNALDSFLGNKAAADVAAAGKITQASFDPATTMTHTLDQWRAAGGHLDLTNFSATRAETKLRAHGTLGLDPAHYLEARLDTQCLGFEPVLRRLGVDPTLISAGSLLSALLGGGGHDAGPQPLHLPVGFTNGRLSIGPVLTSFQVPPLY